jgi:hypothetical protein
MDKRKKQLKKLSLKSDVINTIIGIALIVSLIFVFINPTNRYAILAACLMGGMLNLMNGLKQRKDPIRKSMGMSLIMMGVIVILLGFVILRML